MVRFGRGHKAAPDRTTTPTTTNEETAQAEEVFRDVFADVQGALLYGEDAAKKKGSKNPNPFDDDNTHNNSTSSSSDKDPLTLANSVFRKKKKGTPLLDISETSATSAVSHESHTSGNSNSNTNHWGDSVLTLKTSNQTSNTVNDKSSSTSEQQQSYQWHQVLVATETHRQRSAQQQLRECRNRWQAWTHLVRNSLHETQATVRWYVGIHLARDQLLTSLELGSSLLYMDDEEEVEEENAKDDDDADELPEKPKRVRDESNTDDTVCDTNAAALPPANNNNSHDHNHHLNTTTASPSMTTSTVAAAPPIPSITIPSRNSYPHEPVFVLFRQHNLLHQNLWSLLMMNNNNNNDTTSEVASPQQSCRIQEMVQKLQIHAVVLDQQALERVRQLEQVEEHVQQAWGESLFVCNGWWLVFTV